MWSQKCRLVVLCYVDWQTQLTCQRKTAPTYDIHKCRRSPGLRIRAHQRAARGDQRNHQVVWSSMTSTEAYRFNFEVNRINGEQPQEHGALSRLTERIGSKTTRDRIA